ncbi:MAG: hypothetical protein JSW58_04635 [Candidatus Latescibacterota bacterium]|nr:MAG: hypothetical protein JSW58_04635 [Candidatus Latescibacterota bacterium]
MRRRVPIMAPKIPYPTFITAALLVQVTFAACAGDLRRSGTSPHRTELRDVPTDQVENRVDRGSSRVWKAMDESLTVRYPRSEFLTAWGVSGEGFRQAELDAKARIAERVKSDIETTTTLEASLVKINGETEEHETYLAVVDLHSDFSHAEMIRVDPASLIEIDGHYWAFAYLPRDSVTELLGHEYENKATRFREIVGLGERVADDLTHFTTVFRLAETHFKELTAKASEIRAVSGKPFEPYARDLEIFRCLEARRLVCVATTTVGVEVAAVGEIQRGRLTTLFAEALSKLGVRAEVGGCGACDYVLRVTPVVDWELGLVGEVCRVEFGVELASCRTGRVIASTEISDSRLTVWNMKHENQALRIIMERVSSIGLTEQLRECLHSSMPIS